MSNVHRVKDANNIITAHRFIPYDEMANILKEDGTAFLEQDNDRPLKRQTMHKAAKKLSEMVGKKISYKRAFLRVGEENDPKATYYEGYYFLVESDIEEN